MRRIPLLLALLVMAISVMNLSCRDEMDPQRNVKLMYERAWRETALKNISEIFSKAMQENGNDLAHPEVKKVTDILVPGLSKAYMDFDRDPANRRVIIELLAQMNDPRAKQVFLEGLKLENTSDSKMFAVASNAVQRQKMEEALPALLSAWQMAKTARAGRPGAPFTLQENEIVQAFISAVGPILTEHPNSSSKGAIVQALIEIVDAPDTIQEFRLNMRAMQMLGRIGDAAAIPVLIRGIAQKGVRQPIALGQIAFTALQQINDRDAVIKAVLAFAKGKDEAFNKAYEQELKTDPLMSNPLWFIQQAVTFFGQMRYPSKDCIAFLMEEFNHMEPDELDKKTSGLELQVNMDASGWAEMRRNWAAVALAEMGHTQIIDELVDRIRMRGNRLETPMEEAVGYFRAMTLLMASEKGCPVTLRGLRATNADDSFKDKLFYNASLMCGKEFYPEMDKAIKAINCDKIVKDRHQGEASEDEEKQTRNECEVMKTRIEGYKDRIKFAEECGDKIDCYLKEISNHTSRNIERAIYTAYAIARDDQSKKPAVIDAILENLNNTSRVAITASIMVLDQLANDGGKKLEERIQEVYADFARQSTYRDRARDLEAFMGRVRNRGRK